MPEQKWLPGAVDIGIIAFALDFHIGAVLLQPRLRPDLHIALLGSSLVAQLHSELLQNARDNLPGCLQHFGGTAEIDIVSEY